MTNLKSNTTYNVRAYAKTKAGIAYSKSLNVITTSQIKLAHVKIIKSTFVSKHKITVEGKLLNGPFKEVGFCWDQSMIKPTLKNSSCTRASFIGGENKMFKGTLSHLENHTTYHVRAYAKNKLGVTYSTDTLNVTAIPNPIFGPKKYHKKGLTLIFKNNDPQLRIKCRENVVKTFFIVYPEEKKRFNPQAATTVTFRSDTSYHGVAATYWHRAETIFNANYFESNCRDTDVATQDLMHIVQAYPKYKPVWLTEGIADYARYTFGVNNAAGGWTLPNYSSSQNYTDSYRVTARFLVWLENHGYPKIVDKIDASLRSKRYYKVDMWKVVAGKTIDELWDEYSQNPSLN
jgi:hypothetical protein